MQIRIYMKTKMTLLLSGLLALCILVSCERQEQATELATVPLKIRLTDQPAVFDSAVINLKAIQVKVNSGEWTDLATMDTLVNLLDLQNGITIDIAQGSVPNGTLDAVRFLLGPGNYLVENGERRIWKTPGIEDPGFAVNVGQDLNATINSFTFDFKVNESITTDAGYYVMKPVIQLMP